MICLFLKPVITVVKAVLTKKVVCLKKKEKKTRLVFFLAKALASVEWKNLE